MGYNNADIMVIFHGTKCKDLLPCGWKLNCSRLLSILKYASFCWLSLAPEFEDTLRNRLLGFPHVFQQCRKPLICTCRNFRSLGRRNNSGCAKQGMGERLRLTTHKHLCATVYVYIYMCVCISVYIYVYIMYIDVYRVYHVQYQPSSSCIFLEYPHVSPNLRWSRFSESKGSPQPGIQWESVPWKPMKTYGFGRMPYLC
jgi:hypothetical protein